MRYGSWIYNYLCNQYLSPLTLWVRIPLRWGVLDTLTAGWWVFPGYSGFRHHITEILFKVALNTIPLLSLISSVAAANTKNICLICIYSHLVWWILICSWVILLRGLLSIYQKTMQEKKKSYWKRRKKTASTFGRLRIRQEKKMHEIGIYQKNPWRKIILKKEKKKKIHFDRLRIIHINK